MLAIGSVVTLNGGENKVIISGRKRISTADNKVWDYIGYAYPECEFGEEFSFVFDEEDISEVVFEGYSEDKNECEPLIEAEDEALTAEEAPEMTETEEVPQAEELEAEEAPQIAELEEKETAKPQTVRYMSMEEIMREAGMGSVSATGASQPELENEPEVEAVAENEPEVEAVVEEAEPIAEEETKPVEVVLNYKEGNVDKVVKMASQTLSVGRSVDSDVKLADTFVSKNHASIIIRDNKVYLKDLGSRNGTFVNGNRIDGEIPLEQSTEVKFASTTVKVNISQ